MIEAETPTLWDIRQRLGRPAAVAILVNAFIHAAKLVSLDKNLTSEQIGEAANDILESYNYLKVEEIKYLLKRALRTQNIYGRLDYNVLLNWVEAYDAERTEAAISISEDEDRERFGGENRSDGGTTLSALLEKLKERATAGDAEAAAQIPQIERILGYDKQQQADARQKELDFQQWKQEVYLKSKR